MVFLPSRETPKFISIYLTPFRTTKRTYATRDGWEAGSDKMSVNRGVVDNAIHSIDWKTEAEQLTLFNTNVQCTDISHVWNQLPTCHSQIRGSHNVFARIRPMKPTLRKARLPQISLKTLRPTVHTLHGIRHIKHRLKSMRRCLLGGRGSMWRGAWDWSTHTLRPGHVNILSLSPLLFSYG